MTTDPTPLDPALEQARQIMLDQAHRLPFFQLIGLEIEDLRPCWSRVKIAWRADLCQPAQIMHGGIIATLIDTGIAYALLLSDVYMNSEKSSLVSVDLRIKYLRPVSEGTIYCESTVPKLGKQIIHAESIVKSEDGKDVARGDSIYMVVGRDRLRKE